MPDPSVPRTTSSPPTYFSISLGYAICNNIRFAGSCASGLHGLEICGDESWSWWFLRKVLEEKVLLVFFFHVSSDQNPPVTLHELLVLQSLYNWVVESPILNQPGWNDHCSCIFLELNKRSADIAQLRTASWPTFEVEFGDPEILHLHLHQILSNQLLGAIHSENHFKPPIIC